MANLNYQTGMGFSLPRTENGQVPEGWSKWASRGGFLGDSGKHFHAMPTVGCGTNAKGM
jgi:hypothetical protein